jgi:hypothetical protein
MVTASIVVTRSDSAAIVTAVVTVTVTVLVAQWRYLLAVWILASLGQRGVLVRVAHVACPVLTRLLAV